MLAHGRVTQLELTADVATAGRGPRPRPGAVSRLLADLVHAPEEGRRPRRGGGALPGDLIGRFELLRMIGDGGFGVVFEARDPERDGRVAVKTIRPGAPLEQARESLRREAEAVRLRHPNIVRVLEAGGCDRGPYVVFERLVGETVAERLGRGPLPVEEVIRVAMAVTSALAHAHGRGVLHRDVKPANVFLPSTGEAKLIDFGLASVVGSAGPRGSGTAGYMPPEQRRGGAEDARTDLFAVGLLVHEMAAGKAPAGRDEPRETRAPRSWPAGTPAELERLVAALVEEDPARRPASAGEVLARLLEIRLRLEVGAWQRWSPPWVVHLARPNPTREAGHG